MLVGAFKLRHASHKLKKQHHEEHEVFNLYIFI